MTGVKFPFPTQYPISCTHLEQTKLSLHMIVHFYRFITLFKSTLWLCALFKGYRHVFDLSLSKQS